MVPSLPTMAFKTLQLCPAPPGWYTVYQDDDKVAFEAIAFWALCENEKGETITLPVGPTDFNDMKPGIFSPYTDAPASNFLGIRAPHETAADWQARAAKK